MSEEKKTPEELIEENRPQFIADLIEVEPNTKIEVLATLSLSKLIFSACTDIYMKYSDHKEEYPSFKGFSVTSHDIFREKYININAYDKNFRIQITKMPDEYNNLGEHLDEMSDNVVFRFKIEDNMIISMVSFAATGDTVCDITPLVIPYALLTKMAPITDPANEVNYKDLHDTIFGFVSMCNLTCAAETHCSDDDVFCFDEGFEVAYKKALKRKILLDIENNKTAVKVYEDMVKELKRSITFHNRVVRRCGRSLNKIIDFLKNK